MSGTGVDRIYIPFSRHRQVLNQPERQSFAGYRDHGKRSRWGGVRNHHKQGGKVYHNRAKTCHINDDYGSF